MKIIIWIALSLFGISYGQDTTNVGPYESWHGFRKKILDFNGREAHIILPDAARNGNPWVWRACFPDWHTEIDSALLSRGFHIAFINTNGMYGNPESMEIWDTFYEYLIHDEGLSETVSLEGVSRGGLFIYTWAKRHPERINCIYAEAPVCDIKSWPLGFGKSKGSPLDSTGLMKAYGFESISDAVFYKNNPLDNLNGLAEEKVPVLHVIGLNDKIVPPDENTIQLIGNYSRLGGKAGVLTNKRGNESLEGHHFDLDYPESAIDFILRNTPVQPQRTDNRSYHQPPEENNPFCYDKVGFLASENLFATNPYHRRFNSDWLYAF